MAVPGRVAQRDRLAALLLVGLLLLGGATLLLRRALFETRPDPTFDPRAQRDAVLFDRFSARRERSEEGDRLSVTLRLRTSAAVSLPCYVFFVVRNEQAAPRQWAIWPPQPPGAAITASGHFHGATPAAGEAITLSDTWERVTATLPHPPGAAFESVTLYVVDPGGRILLARPFRL